MTSDPTGSDPTAAFNYITAFLSQMNGNSTLTTPSPFTDPFASFPSQIITAGGYTGDSSVTPNQVEGGITYTSYNFAVARVRLNGPIV